MQAAQYSAYGVPKDVLKVSSLNIPEIEHPDELIIKVSAAGINPVDYKVMQGDLKLVFKVPFPSVPGLDFSGVVTARGSAVVDFNVSDEVYGRVAAFGRGTTAEYIKVSTTRDVIKIKPPNVSHTQAASVGTAAMTASTILLIHGKINESKGKKVLVIGASGGVGSWVVQIAKHLGAVVTGICSKANIEYVRKLGADTVIDYTAAPLESTLTTTNEFDLVADCVGGENYWNLSQKILKPNGSFVTAVGPTAHGNAVTFGAVFSLLGGLAWKSLTNTRKYSFVGQLPKESFESVHTWISGGFITPVANQIFPLDSIVQAYEVLQSHRSVGKIVNNIEGK
ncbi:hypothetical protein HK096_008793 [Nowakowskiella sp. JEL0078]|nr:hypothetical protein HK096_008793 [Nowakowskiella sp. JEL0078]